MAAVDTNAPEITEERFVAEATEFLEANAKRKAERREFVWGQGPDNAALFEEIDHEAEQQELAAAKQWRAAKFDAGYGWITGPCELGGSGLPRKFERLWMNLEGQFDTPDGGFFGIGYVTPDQEHRGEPDPIRAAPCVGLGDLSARDLQVDLPLRLRGQLLRSTPTLADSHLMLLHTSARTRSDLVHSSVDPPRQSQTHNSTAAQMVPPKAPASTSPSYGSQSSRTTSTWCPADSTTGHQPTTSTHGALATTGGARPPIQIDLWSA